MPAFFGSRGRLANADPYLWPRAAGKIRGVICSSDLGVCALLALKQNVVEGMQGFKFMEIVVVGKVQT